MFREKLASYVAIVPALQLDTYFVYSKNIIRPKPYFQLIQVELSLYYLAANPYGKQA